MFHFSWPNVTTCGGRIRRGYPPAIIYKRQRAQYLKALSKADKGERVR
jgi:hypothetical protein